MHRKTAFAIAVALAGVVVAFACGSGGQGLNFGCGPDDPCCAAGTWYFDCNEPTTDCGGCSFGGEFTVGPITIPAGVARDGGTVLLGDAGATFDVSTCSIPRLTTTCKAPLTFRFGSGGPSYDRPISCANTSTNTCLQVCGSYTCKMQAQ